MKRFYHCCIIAIILFCLCACHLPNGDVSVSTETPEPESPAVVEEELTLVTPIPTDTPEPPTPTPTPTPTPEPTPSPTPTPTPEPSGLIGWSEGGFVPREQTVVTDTEYIGENLHFTVTTIVDNELFGHRLTYYVTDIYLRDIHCLRTASAKGFKSFDRDSVAKIAERENALLAISGDMFNAHTHQLVIRNGEIYDTKLYNNWDVCFLYLDGTMETMTADEYRSATLREDIWQAWQFGPSLLDEGGRAKDKFPNSQIKPLNPRCAIGYFEPGHYCFVIADGRQSHSRGLELKELSKLMEMLGCKVAFNLDGGESASLYWNGGIYNKAFNGGRNMADIVYLINWDESAGS